MKPSFVRSLWSVAVLAVGLSLVAANARADKDSPESRLKGTYAISRFRACVQTDGDFSPGLQVIGGTFANSRTNVIQGRVTFNGDGTGTMDIDGTQLRMNGGQVAPGGFPINSTQSQCNFTYSVNPDNSFTLNNTCPSATVAGAGAGNTSVLSGIVLHGQIASGGQLLVIGDNEPNVETLVQNPGTPDERTFKRICVRSGTAARVHK